MTLAIGALVQPGTFAARRHAGRGFGHTRRSSWTSDTHPAFHGRPDNPRSERQAAHHHPSVHTWTYVARPSGSCRAGQPRSTGTSGLQCLYEGVVPSAHDHSLAAQQPCSPLRQGPSLRLHLLRRREGSARPGRRRRGHRVARPVRLEPRCRARGPWARQGGFTVRGVLAMSPQVWRALTSRVQASPSSRTWRSWTAPSIDRPGTGIRTTGCPVNVGASRSRSESL